MNQMIQINDTTWINKGFIQDVELITGEEGKEIDLKLDKMGLLKDIQEGIRLQDELKNKRDSIKKQIETLKGDKDKNEEYNQLTKELDDLRQQSKVYTEKINKLKPIQDLFNITGSPDLESYIEKLEKADTEKKYYSVKTETIPGESYYEITFINGVKKEIKHPEEMQVVTDNILKAEA